MRLEGAREEIKKVLGTKAYSHRVIIKCEWFLFIPFYVCEEQGGRNENQRTLGWNCMRSTRSFHTKNLFPMSERSEQASERVSSVEGASEASSAEQANEWAVWANERNDEWVAQYSMRLFLNHTAHLALAQVPWNFNTGLPWWWGKYLNRCCVNWWGNGYELSGFFSELKTIFCRHHG